MAKTIDKLDKSVQQTLDMSGYATTNHGTHVTFTSTAPKVAGTAAVGSATTVSRSDHVHPLQTTVSGNAGTATKLATARTLTIGNTGKAFNGSANVSWSLSDIGALPAAGGNVTGNIKVTNDSYLEWNRNTDYARISFKNTGDSDSDSYMHFLAGDNGNEYFKFSTLSGSTTTDLLTIKTDHLRFKGYNVYHAGNKPTLADIGAAASSHGTHVTYSSTAPKVAGTASVGSESTVARGDHIHAAQTTISGNAGSATKLATARTLTVGNTGKTFNGSANVSWSLSEIGAAAASHTHSYLPLSGGEMTGRLRLTTAATTTDASTPTQLAYGLLGSYGNLKVLGNTDTSVGADNEYVHIAAGWGLDPAVNKGIVVRGTYAECFGGTIRPQYSKTINLTASTYNVNTWYPCVPATSIPYGGLHRINLAVQLDSGSKPSWSTHDAGFTCNIDVLATAGGWGTTSAYSICLQDYYSFANNRPAGYQQLNNSSKPLFYLRGGGKYTIYTDYDTGAWTIYTASTTINSETFAPTTTAPGVSINRSTVFTNISGNASSASKLETARTLTIGNTGKTFNGSGNQSWTLSEIGAAAASHGNHYLSKSITTNFDKTFRQSIKGDTNFGQFLSTVRTDTASVNYAPQYSSGIAWGQSDTNGYLMTHYGSAQAFIGGGNANKLNWVRQISFTDHTHSNYATTTTTGSLSSLKTKAKGNLVAAINEVFQSGNNVKKSLVDTLVAKGMTDASTSKTWTELINMIKDFRNVFKLNGIFNPMSCGDYYSVAVKGSRLYVAGQNSNGQLGLGNTETVLGFTASFSVANVAQIATGAEHVLVLTKDGTLYGAGSNFYGQLGLGTSITKAQTFTVLDTEVEQISCGAYYSMILKNNGELWVAGQNSYGQLGLGNTNNVMSWTRSTMSNIVRIACHSAHASVLRDDGTVWTCGLNGSGQLGLGDTTNRAYFSEAISLGSDVVDLAIGSTSISTMAIKKDGTVWGCGYNAYGQIGTGNTKNVLTFTKLSITNVSQIAVGYYHTLFLKKDGTVYSCGRNTYGQLGLGTTTNTSTITKCTSTSVTQYTIKGIEVGELHSLIYNSNNQLLGCGYNSNGQLNGNGTSTYTTFTNLISLT